MNKEILQTMKILPIEQVCSFEWNTYPQETVDIDEIIHIRHPFLVTPLPKGKFLLLEDSTEFYLLKQAGIRQLPVQIISLDQLTLYQNSIGFYSFDKNDLHEILSTYKDTIICSPTSLDIIENESVHLYFDKNKFQIKSIGDDKGGCSNAVSMLFQYIVKNGGFRMLDQNGSLSDSLMKIRRYDATVELPELKFQDIIDAVAQNRLFPPSVITVKADIRMLYIDFPVTTLVSENSITEKEVFLRELILLREQTEKTSMYHGKVYLLNR